LLMSSRRIRDMLREFEREIEETIEEILDNITGTYEAKPLWSKDGTLEPLVSVVEKEDKYVITIDLPLANLETLSITGKYNYIELKCKLKQSIKLKEWPMSRAEFREYRKVITLPKDADVAKFEVRKYVEHSIIEVIVPKKKT